MRIASLALLFTLVSSSAFAFGPNETLFTILSASGFASETVSRTQTISVTNVYCDEKSARRVKCTANQDAEVIDITDDRAFLDALRGDAAGASAKPLPGFFARKSIYTLAALECSATMGRNGGTPFYACTLTP